MNPKDIALGLLKIAAAVFPPLAELVDRALDSHEDSRATAEERSLADEIRAQLPEKSATRKALDELDAGGG